MDDPHEPGAEGGLAPDATAGALLLDVRRAAAYLASPVMIAGAHWRDPAEVAHWLADLPAGQRVVAYCVHGHEVSQDTARRLRAAGLDAWHLQGGIERWQAEGRPLQPRPPG